MDYRLDMNMDYEGKIDSWKENVAKESVAKWTVRESI